MSGLVLWMGALAVAGLLAFGVAEVGQAAVDEARAAAAADAAALAGAAAGVEAATVAALRNEATLVSFSQVGEVATVTVRVSGHSATAHARRELIAIN